jgi:DNA-binding NarL/FixJ family response regulator
MSLPAATARAATIDGVGRCDDGGGEAGLSGAGTAEGIGVGSVKVMIVDDEALVRSGVSMILGTASGIQVVATCSGPDAVEMFLKHRPDVVLLDIRMPVVDGLTVLRQLRDRSDPPAVVMLTTFSADAQVASALRDGAAGFLLKDSEPDDLVAAVRALAAGSSVLSPAVTGAVIAGFVASHPSTEVLTRVTALSDRERDILALVGQGLSNVAIAERLFLSVPTVKEHVSAILLKLGADNRVQAAVIAHQAGVIPRP